MRALHFFFIVVKYTLQNIHHTNHFHMCSSLTYE